MKRLALFLLSLVSFCWPVFAQVERDLLIRGFGDIGGLRRFHDC